LNGSGGRT